MPSPSLVTSSRFLLPLICLLSSSPTPSPLCWWILGICHSATPLSLFSPISPSALWQPSITCWRHGDRGPWGTFIRPGVNTPGLYDRCRLTAQRSPPPHLDKSLGPRASTVYTHTNRQTDRHPDPQHPQMNTLSEQRASTRCRREPTAQSQTPHHSSTRPRVMLRCALICLMFSILWK